MASRLTAIAQIQAALRRAEDALRRGDPDALAGRFAPLNTPATREPKTAADAMLKVGSVSTPEK